MEPIKSKSSGNPHAQALQVCSAEAMAEAPGIAMRWVSGLLEELRLQESWAVNAAEKSSLAAATKQLTQHRAQFEQRWVENWGRAVTDAVVRPGAADAAATRRALGTVRFEELELMDEMQVQATVHVAKLEQQVEGASGDALSELTSLLSRAQGFSSVKADQNPLRPEVVISALRRTIESLSPDKGVRALWLQHGTKTLGLELQTLYRHLVRILEKHGVTPAEYNVLQAPSSPINPLRQGGATRFRPAGVAEQEALVAPSQLAPGAARLAPAASDMLTLGHLHDLLVGGGQVPSPAPPVLNVKVPAPLAVPGGVLTDRPPSLPTPVVAPPPGTGKPYRGPDRRAGVRQQDSNFAPLKDLASEVVHLMLDGMTRDARLLAPVRDVLVRLQPALLRIAQEDPRFFADKLNPARRLLDEMTQKSLAYTSEKAPGFTDFLASLDDVVQLFSRSDAKVTDLFETALEVLSPPKSAPTAAYQVQLRGKAVASLVKAEQRFMVAEKVATEMAERKDFAKAPSFIKTFLTGPWSQVIAQARVEPAPEGQTLGRLPADQRYAGMVSDLLWSSRPERAARNRGRLARLIPGVLRTLREGLQTIDYLPEQSREFFSALMALHEAGMKGPAEEEAAPPKTEFLLPPVEEDAVWLVEPRPWLRPSEAADSGFMEDPFPELEVTDFADTMPLMDRAEGSGALPELMPSEGGVQPLLLQGAWIDFQQTDDSWVRMQLTWASPHGTMYLFSGPGGDTASMTRRSLDTLWSRGRVRMVASHSLVEDALDGVMDAAVNNSVRDDLSWTNYEDKGTDLLPPLA